MLTALVLPLLIGSTALAVEYGVGLVTRSSNQRTGDAAAFAGAIRYTASRSEDDMRAAALQVASLNGVDPSVVSVALVPSPRGTGDAVEVRIASNQQLYLAPILGVDSLLTVSTESLAAIGSAAAGACVLALDPSQSGVVLSGGTSLSASECSVASNATVSVPCGTTITAQTVFYDTLPPQQACSGIRSPDGSEGKITKLSTPDPLVDNQEMKSATDRIETRVATMPSLSAPPATGPDIVLGYNPKAPIAAKLAPLGCSLGNTAEYSGQWQIICTGDTVRAFGSIRVEGGATASFSGGNYQVARGIVATDAAKVSFGSGTFHVGAAVSGCVHSICALSGATLSIDGPSTFRLAAGFETGGGTSLRLGAGQDNLFDLGASSNGTSIVIGGGSKTFMGNAEIRPDAFRVRGHIQGGGGGSCIVISRAPQHDITGNVRLDGAAIIGAGIYTIDGSFLLGATNGGGADCFGRWVSVEAIDVTIVVSGKTGVSSGSCANMAFCIGAGYGNVVFRAPSEGDTAGFAVIGPTNGNTMGASLTEGAGNARISGAFYFPTGPIIMNGGAGLGGGGGDCLQLIGSRISLSGGASAATDCLASVGGGKKYRVVLVQ